MSVRAVTIFFRSQFVLPPTRGQHTVTIRLNVTAQEFRLEIVDDGLGFQNGAREGVGIRGMRERLKELGGTLYVESGENLGSSVTGVIPLNHAT